MKEKIAKISILVNVLLSTGKILAGYFGMSASVLADGIHSLTDVFSSTVSFLGIRAASKPSDKKHPYGHYKYEVLSGMVITILLFVTGAFIVYKAVQGFGATEQNDFEYFAIFAMGISAIVNGVMAKVKISSGKNEGSFALISDGAHSRVDVYSSLVIFVGLFLNKYFVYTDSILAIVVGFYIIYESFGLGREAMDSLLDVSAGEETENNIKKLANEAKFNITDLKTQRKGSAITANIEIELPKNLKLEEATEISENLRKKLMDKIENLNYVAIQIKSHEVETGYYKPSLGKGMSWKRKGRFEDSITNAEGKGVDGICVCLKCGYSVPHQRGIPCSSIKCPKCGTELERK